MVSPPSRDASAAAAGQRRLILQAIYMYTVLLHVALPAVLFVLYGQGNFALATPAWAKLPSDPLALGAVAFAVVALVVAHVVPPKRATKDPASPTPYIVRICATELCVVAGFALGLLRQTPEFCVPFAAIGLVLVLLSPPPKGDGTPGTPA